eukprot:3937957-Rhodomonas_salina.1
MSLVGLALVCYGVCDAVCYAECAMPSVLSYVLRRVCYAWCVMPSALCAMPSLLCVCYALPGTDVQVAAALLWVTSSLRVPAVGFTCTMCVYGYACTRLWECGTARLWEYGTERWVDLCQAVGGVVLRDGYTCSRRLWRRTCWYSNSSSSSSTYCALSLAL